MKQRIIVVPTMRRAQRGFGILSALLALVIGSIVAAGQIQGQQVQAQQRSGIQQADLVKHIIDAGNTYAMENHYALQNNLPVTKNGTTLAVGSSFGQAMAPTIENLVSMGYLSAGTSAQASINNGTYRMVFRREPAGCAPSSCNIPGSIYVDQPVLRPGTTEMNGVAIGAYMSRLGGDVLVSLNTSPTLLTSMSGATFANPVSGTPNGVIGAMVGFGSSGFGQFLVVNDYRDPNFQGNVTVAGKISTPSAIVSNSSIGVGPTGGSCLLGEILTSGNIVSRSVACVRRAWLDGTNGQVGVADTAGVTRALMDGTTGEINSRDASGTVRSGFTYSGASSVVFADNVRNTAGSGGVLADGTVYGSSLRNNASTAGVKTDGSVYGVSGAFDSITINKSAAIGGVCPTENAAVWGVISASPVLLKCSGGKWTPTNGTAIASVGGGCPVNNQQGLTTDGVGLICQGGQWMLTADRMGKFALASTVIVYNGTTVSKPACSSGGTAKIYMVPQAIDASALYANFLASDNGSSWTTRITDNAGVATVGKAIAAVGCFYL